MSQEHYASVIRLSFEHDGERHDVDRYVTSHTVERARYPWVMLGAWVAVLNHEMAEAVPAYLPELGEWTVRPLSESLRDLTLDEIGA